MFWPVTHAHFINYDDPDVISQNDDFLHPETADLSHYWERPYLGLYTPVSYIVLGLASPMAHDASNTLDPAAFHDLSIAVHFTSTLWVFVILKLLFDASTWRSMVRWSAATAGALLFAIHPLQVEAVSWAASLNTPLSGMFSLWAIWHGLKYLTLLERNKEPNPPITERRIHAAAAFVIFALALLSKPSAVIAPGILAILSIGVLRLPWRSTAWFLIPWAIEILPIALLTQHVQAVRDHAPTPLLLRPLIAADSLAFYLNKLLLPIRLIPDYGRTPWQVIENGYIHWTWIVVAAVGLLTFFLRRRVPIVISSFMVFSVALLPELGLVPFEHQIFSTVADRYAYLSLLGAAIVVGKGIGSLLSANQGWKGLTIPALVMITLGIASYRQSSRWHDDHTLFDYTLKINPRSLAAHRVLGFDASRQGDTAAAIDQFQQAIATHPGDGYSEFYLGNLFLKSDHPSEAAKHYEIAAVQMPDRAQLFNNLGIAFQKMNETSRATEAYTRATQINPPSADAHCNLAVLLSIKGDYAAAISHYKTALELNPQSISAQKGLEQLMQYLRTVQNKNQPRTGPN